MRLNLHIFLLVYSLYGFAQLFVTESTIIGLETLQSEISSHESLYQIDALIFGAGTHYLNNTMVQELTITQEFLELPNIQLQNAHSQTTIHGQLIYTTQFQELQPLTQQPTLLIKYTRPKMSQPRPQTEFIATSTSSNFGSSANNSYTMNFKTHTPPPELIGAIS